MHIFATVIWFIFNLWESKTWLDTYTLYYNILWFSFCIVCFSNVVRLELLACGGCWWELVNSVLMLTANWLCHSLLLRRSQMPSLSFPWVLVGLAATIQALGAAGFGLGFLGFFCPLHQSCLLVAHPLVRSCYGDRSFYQDWLFFFFIFSSLLLLLLRRSFSSVSYFPLAQFSSESLLHAQISASLLNKVFLMVNFFRLLAFKLLRFLTFAGGMVTSSLSWISSVFYKLFRSSCHCHPSNVVTAALLFHLHTVRASFYLRSASTIFFLSTAPPVPLTESPSLSSH